MTHVALVILGQHSVPLARDIMTALPESTLYGLANRTADVDIHFTNFSDTLRELFSNNTPIIGICAAGILIRVLAPLLTDKWREPPVLAVAEDGSAVVPLLGGLHGVNDLARQVAEVLQVAPAITTTGDIRFRTALLAPPAGYHLANPDHAKTFIADVLAGASVKLVGEAHWLQESQAANYPRWTVNHPDHRTGCDTDAGLSGVPSADSGHWDVSKTGGEGEREEAINEIMYLLTQADLAPASIAGIFALDSAAGDPVLHATAQALNVPARFFTYPDITPVLQQHSLPASDYQPMSIASALALAAAGPAGQLISIPSPLDFAPYAYAIALAPLPMDPHAIGRGRGWLAIVGTGPGSAHWMSPEVKDILQSATDWVGYKTYLDLAEPIRTGQRRHEFDNREELGRAYMALDLAAAGRAVALVSSGDPGIYAMAAAVFEVMEREDEPAWRGIEIQVCPGISAMQAAAAQVGAPLGHDFCAISLSDILKPWFVIEQRIAAAAQADFVLVFYNPVSKQRTWQLHKAREILLQWRSPHTPVILAHNLGRPGQAVIVQRLDQLTPADADMRTIILVGSSQTRLIQRDDGRNWVYTPRHYDESKGTGGVGRTSA